MNKTRNDTLSDICQRAKQILENDFASPWTLTTLAREVGLSSVELQPAFKALTGKSASQFLTDVRLDKACEFLVAGNSVSETAGACGFPTPASLSERFLRRTGIYASHYRFRMVGYKNSDAALEKRAPIKGQSPKDQPTDNSRKLADKAPAPRPKENSRLSPADQV